MEAIQRNMLLTNELVAALLASPMYMQLLSSSSSIALSKYFGDNALHNSKTSLLTPSHYETFLKLLW